MTTQKNSSRDDDLAQQFAAFVRLFRQQGWSDDTANTAQRLGARIDACQRRVRHLDGVLHSIAHSANQATWFGTAYQPDDTVCPQHSLENTDESESG
ncbi:MAG: hypothetical protein JRD89_03505 [Deltaproteobacteria bacterium]|nr:hypothetical protein [Deltaproteobacteria bacterium]